ncbi:MAG: hypothetical protein Q4Q06_02755 [Bacteroidota bacterium]|nr:hypothetical protein [Bacteroidota bacterium]
MKKIIYSVSALLLGMVLYSCSDTTDCICPVNTVPNISVNKATSNVPVTDWDGDCSDITDEDLDGQILNGDCTEQ